VLSVQTVGWVCDRATSKRRIRVAVTAPDCVELLVEVYGQQASIVELDRDGVGVLGRFVVEALARLVEAADAREAP
jgi:hypothetical protein